MVITDSLEFFENNDLTDADQVFSNFSFIIDAILVNQYNIDVDGTVSTTIPYDHYTRLQFDNDADDTNSTVCKSNARYFAQDTYDSYSDASIDATKWTTSTAGTGTATETADTYIEVQTSATSSTASGSATMITNGSGTSLDFYGDKAVKFYLYFVVSNNNGQDTSNATFQVSNGSTHVNILSRGAGTPGNDSGYYEMVFDQSGTQVRVWKDGAEMGASPFNLASVTTNWYLRATTDATANAPTDSHHGTVRFYRLGEMQTATQYDFVFGNETESGTMALGRIIWDKAPASYVVKNSINNGSTYPVTMTESVLANLTTFTQQKYKVEATTEASVTLTTENVPELDEWYYWFG